MSQPWSSQRFVRSARRLTDDLQTTAPRSRSLRAYFRDAVDRLAGADPSLTQLRTALQAVLSIALAVGIVDLFVRLTGALQKTGSGSAITTANHGLLVVSMLLAGMVAMLSGFAVTDSSASGQIISTLILPIQMIASMSAGLILGGYRLASLIFLVALMATAVYVRRWGQRGFACGSSRFQRRLSGVLPAHRAAAGRRGMAGR